MMMTTLAYIVVGFGLLRLVIATLNLLLQEKLPRPKSGESLPSLSVLIPARNEAHNIEALLSDLTHVESESLLEIIVCDDASEDSTVELVDTWMQRDSRIRLIYSSGPPSGWLGKNHACHLLSREARGEYLLFLDADVRLRPAFIERALSYATTYRLSLLSLFPRQRMQTWAERVSVPNMHLGGSYILALLYWSLTSMGWLAVWLGRANLLLLYLLTEVAIRVFVSFCSNQSIVYNIVLAPAQQLLLGLFIIKSWVNSRRKLGFTWKGRSI